MTTEEFERYAPIDEQMDFHEKLRLLYVALTRARDHLVVSVHRAERTLPDDQSTWTHAELLWGAAESAPHWTEFTADARRADRGAAARARRHVGARPSRPSRPGTSGAPNASSCSPRRRIPHVRSATAIAREVADAAERDPGLRKGARDLELPPWNKGRYGTAIGRAVHAVLQTVDLATGANLEHIAAAQAASEGVIGKEPEIAALARAAIESDVVRDAVAHGFRREMYVAAPVGDHLLEGYIDLTYRDEAGSCPNGKLASGGGRLQDRRLARRGRPRREGAALPVAGRVVRGGARSRDGRTGGGVRVLLPHPGGRGDAPGHGPSGGDAPGTSTARGVRRSRVNTMIPPIGPVITTTAV